jgi:hypothetical protein
MGTGALCPEVNGGAVPPALLTPSTCHSNVIFTYQLKDTPVQTMLKMTVLGKIRKYFQY